METKVTRSKLELRGIGIRCAALLALPLALGCSLDVEGVDEQTEETGVSSSALEVTQSNAAESLRAAGISCDLRFGESDFSAKCGFMGPTLAQYRAVAYCTDNRYHYGAWKTVNSGAWSRAFCGNNRFVLRQYVDIR
jgi:hypothetical protein